MNRTRREFIRISATAAGGLVLAACADDDTASTSGSDVPTDVATGDAAVAGATTATTPAPSAGDADGGGVVRVAVLASPSDTMDPATVAGFLDYVIMFHIYDSLVVLQGGEVVNQLAASIEPNDDATEWTVVLNEAVFHDGSPVTAADVAYSINHLGQSANYGPFFALIDLPNMVAVDDLTLTVPLLEPRGDLVESVFSQLSFVVPDGFTDWGRNIGSGPFTLVSYEPGVGAELARNPDYWGTPATLDGLRMVGIADPATRYNALRSGDIDYASGVPSAAVAAEEAAGDIEIRRGDTENSTMRCIVMNVQQPPFDDPDVVLACKLAVDRQAMIDVVLFGGGTIGNDMPSKGLPGYDDSVPQRERDIDQARRLFAGAGVDAFTIRAADLFPGVVASAELFAQQLAEAGVTVTVERADPATYFDDFATVLSTPCQAFYFINRPAITHVSSYVGSRASFNATGFATPEFDAALADAQATPDAAEREAKVRALLQTLHDSDGNLIWAFEAQLDAARPGIDGVELVQSLPIFREARLT